MQCGVLDELRWLKLQDAGVSRRVQKMRLRFVFPFFTVAHDHRLLAERSKHAAIYTEHLRRGVPESLLRLDVRRFAASSALVEMEL